MTKEIDNKSTSSDSSDVLDHHSLVKEQAAIWLIRISDESLTPEEVDTLREWIGRSDFHREYFVQLSQNWDEMAVLQELAELFAVPRADADVKKRNPLSFLTYGPFFPRFAAAISLAIFSIALWFHLAVFDSQAMKLQTAIGEQRTEYLDDGSVLTINTDTELSVDYSGDNRIIRLSRGEVNFDVFKDPHRPFVVYAGDGLVWAVGTAFNIRLGESGVDLTVTEGRVKVYSGVAPSEPLPTLSSDIPTGTEPSSSLAHQNEAFVKAGEMLQYDQAVMQKVEVQVEQLQKKLAWQRGGLIFKGETLEQALVEIRRYTDKDLRIVDPVIKYKQIGGYYKTDDIDGLLRSMSQSYGIRVAYKENDVINLSSK